MALTESTMLPLGTLLPHFSLPDTVSDKLIAQNDIQGSAATVVLFLCNHCPYVVHINEELVRLANDYSPKGIAFVAISSNDAVKYPQDGPDLMKTHAQSVGYPFPYLYDETQEVARAFDAACTPDIFVFDGENRLVYRGQLDDSRPNSGKPVTGKELRAALEAILNGMTIPHPQRASAGCNIKWK